MSEKYKKYFILVKNLLFKNIFKWYKSLSFEKIEQSR